MNKIPPYSRKVPPVSMKNVTSQKIDYTPSETTDHTPCSSAPAPCRERSSNLLTHTGVTPILPTKRGVTPTMPAHRNVTTHRGVTPTMPAYPGMSAVVPVLLALLLGLGGLGGLGGVGGSVVDLDLYDGSGEVEGGDRTVLVSVSDVTSGVTSDTGDVMTSESDVMTSGGDVPYSTLTARDVVDTFLSIVDQYEQNRDNCTPGVEFSLGDGVVAQYGVKRFMKQALSAVNRANLLTALWKGAPRGLLKSEFFFYTQVRNLVESDPDIFAAGNCYAYKEYKRYALWCPFGHRARRDSAQVVMKDLALGYDYRGNQSEFFWIPRQKAEAKLRREYLNMSIGYSSYRLNSTHYQPTVREDSLLSVYEDGHWSKPYFDCGGGDIWMMTYTVPFFGYNKQTGKYHFKGTSGIDIDLQKVDIDQCPLPDGTKALNVFAGSDKCKPKTTKCVPVHGLGFRRGSYTCMCKDGYYFPDTSLPISLRYYNGSTIEYEYERFSKGLTSKYAEGFMCVKCALGCTTCVDGSPCILALNWVQRSIVLGCSCCIMAFIPMLVWFTFRYSRVKVLKAASPLLLRIILLGASLLYLPLIVQYFEPTVLSCTVRLWMREIGFAISYGALLLKTWRISVVFRVRSARAIKISDADLIKRLFGIVLIFAIFLSVRMIVGRPRVVKGAHSSGLHTFQCSWDVWDYCAAIAELCLLLWGIRLCIVVRKAPSEFNESRFISWAIYNETLLSLFLNITMFFLQSPANPDLLYLIMFIHSQLTTTVTLAFLFGSKAYLVYKYSGKEQPSTTISRGSKYVAAPKSTHSTMMSTVTTSGNCTSLGEKMYDEIDYDNGPTLEKDIQDEFKRLYMQLELLKQKNMKLGNPHLTHKLSAMTEAAIKADVDDDVITDCDVMTQGMCDVMYAASPTSPNMNGKRVVINLDDFKDATSL